MHVFKCCGLTSRLCFSFATLTRLGKTIQVLGLVVATLEDVKEKSLQQKQTDVYGNDFYRHATLIIVPPALLSQWVSEIQKVAPWLVVDVLINGSDVVLKRVQQQHPTEGAMDQDADIVLTTYQALEDNHYSSAKKQKKKQVRRTKHSSCQESEDFPTTKIITLSEITWGRIVSAYQCPSTLDSFWLSSRMANSHGLL